MPLLGMLEELRRRNVIRVGVAYLALAWFVIEVTDVAVPALNLPESLNSIVFYIGLVGLPFALLFAWAFELTPEGIKREHEVDRVQSVTASTGRKIDFVIIGLLLATILFLVVDNYVLEQSGEAQRAIAEATGSVYGSIGVLPFDNMSNDPDQEYFSDGIAEELLNALAKLKNLRVAARTSSFAFKGQNQNITEIGNKLNVDTMLEGSVRKSGTRLRITAQLIDVENGYHLWSETYDRELTDVFAIQDELTAAIVSALKVHLGVGEQARSATATNNWEAYDLYLKGLHAIRQRTDSSVAAAIKYFEQATTLEPDFPMALARQAQAVMLSVTYGGAPREEAQSTAAKLIARALAQDPKLAEAHAAKGYLLLEKNSCEQALLSFDRALALNPGLVEALHWRGLCLKSLGRLRDSLAAARYAHRLDPLHASVFTNLASFETDYGMDVVLNTDAAMENYPDRYVGYQFDRALRKAKYAQMIALVGEFPGDPMSPVHEIFAEFALGENIETRLADLLETEDLPIHDIYVFMQILLGDFEEAERYLEELSSDALKWDISADSFLGYIYYLSGNYPGAVSALGKSLAQRARFGIDYPSFPLSRVNLSISLADALQRTGEKQSAETHLDWARGYLATLKDNGARKGYQLPEARLLLMQGDEDAAIELLEQVVLTGDELWMRGNAPLISRLAGNERMIALRKQIDDHIDAERAELGLLPLSERDE
mgnify:CR=1 FL=1